jgi:RNA polymerase primary sigma factor
MAATHDRERRSHQARLSVLAALLERGWITLDELLKLASDSPVDVDEAISLAREAGIDVVDRPGDAWEDLRTLANDGPDAFRPVREGPATSEELTVDDPATLYLREIGRAPLLTAQQEVELAQELEAGRAARGRLEAGQVSAAERTRLDESVRIGDAARQRLIESNLRLVVSVARKYLGRGVSFLDLVQEGNIGLQRGVDKYDWHRGFRFSTYGYWWIRQAVSRAVAEQGRTIRLPGHLIERLGQLYNAARELQEELGRAPNTQEIAHRMNVEPERVREAFRAARIPISLEKPIGDDATATLANLIADVGALRPDAEAEERVLAENLDRALYTHLAPREAAVIRLRFGLDRGGLERTLGEVGKELGISRERVRQLEAEAMATLRRASSFRDEFGEYAQ